MLCSATSNCQHLVFAISADGRRTFFTIARFSHVSWVVRVPRSPSNGAPFNLASGDILKKVLKWSGFVIAGVGVIVGLVFAYVFFASERALHRHYAAVDGPPLTIPGDAAGIAAGKRIAQLAGCTHCHGERLNGSVVDDIPHLARLVAPNISVALPAYTDAQLATVLRKGVKPDGSSVLFMPSEMYRHLADEDLARLIAYLRTIPATAEGVQEKTEVRIVGRMLLAAGEFKPAALAIETLPPAVNSFVAGDPSSLGRHLAMTYCSECHGQDLGGFPQIDAPPLTVAKGYSTEAFAKLMHDGIPQGDRELKLMGPTSRVRFSNFTPDEVAAVHAYLQSRS
jgi:cytochrome c553